MKKKISAILSVFILASAVSSCGKSEPAVTTGTAEVTEVTTTAPETKPAVPEAPALTVPDNAVDYAAIMKLGWNLGNTLDATGEGPGSETSWGQPTVNKAQIQYVKDSGFTSIRIPISWSNHVDEDNNIDPEWMTRVTEVVDYAYECGLYIIINAHHDCERYYPTAEKAEEASQYLKDIWTQIADNFAEYDDRLIFESMNEPRLKDTSKEWWFQNTDEDGIAAIECIVKLNQVFVDTIRSNGKGNNPTRYLMVPSYAASPDFALHNSFEMPTDTIKDKLLVSVHAYTPYDFAMNKRGYKEWDESKKSEFGFMKKLDKKFTQNGYGVVIGEFGATNKGNLEARSAWAKDYTSTASSYGISCFLWDNGGIMVGEENFGMVNRREFMIYYPAMLEALLAGYEETAQDIAA